MIKVIAVEYFIYPRLILANPLSFILNISNSKIKTLVYICYSSFCKSIKPVIIIVIIIIIIIIIIKQ